MTNAPIIVPVADDKTKTGVAEMGNFVDFPELHYRDGRTAFVGRGKDPDNAALPPEPACVPPGEAHHLELFFLDDAFDLRGGFRLRLAPKAMALDEGDRLTRTRGHSVQCPLTQLAALRFIASVFCQ